MTNIKKIAEGLTKISPIIISDCKTALENDIQQAQMVDYPDTTLSPKEYGMKLRKYKKNR